MFNLRRRRGFSLIELLIVVAIILILVTMAVPKIMSALKYSKETAAIVAIRTIHTAQQEYMSHYGRFATSLTELGPPATGTANAAAAELIGNDLALGENNGYKYTVTGNESGYQIVAVPVSFGVTGSRTFFSDQTMVVRENDGPEPATASSKELNAKAATAK
jgi:prepilin-type N-terminal cleavage/methylation domain-containing protein